MAAQFDANPKRPRSWAGSDSPVAPAKADKKTKRHRRFYLLGAGILGLLGAIAAMLLLVIDSGPKLFFLSIPVTEYRERFYPVNAWAEQDGYTLRELLTASSRPSSKGATIAYESQSREPMMRQLDALATRGEPTVVVHLSALARSHKGEVYLLPADANPDQPGTWLALTQVLESVQRCPARNKLLILDVGRPVADPRLGILANDVGGSVHEQLSRLQNENKLPFWVLTGCQANEVALVWEDQKHSVLGHFLAEGLRGHADGSLPQNTSKDQRVSVQEMTEYATKQIADWTSKYRNVAQTVHLYGQADDFTLVNYTKILHQDPPAPDTYPDWLTAGWQQRDKWWTEGAYLLSPRLFRQIEAALLRAEQRWRGGVGGDADRIQKELAADLRALQDQYQQVRDGARRPLARSLAQEKALGREPDESATTDLKQLLAKLAEQGSGDPKEAAKAQQKLLGDFTKKYKEAPPFDLAWAAFDMAAGDDSPAAEKIKLLDQLVRGQQPTPRYLEAMFLQQIAALAGDETKKWNPEVVHWAFRTVQIGERANAADPSLLPWVRGLLDETGAKRLEGETLLLAGGPPSKLLKAQEILQAAEARYQDIAILNAALEDAYRLIGEAVTVLPGHVPYVIDRPQYDTGIERDWLRAATIVQTLIETLARPSNHPLNTVSEFQKQTTELRQCLSSLKQPFAPETLKRLTADAPRGDVAQFLEMQALLESPRLAAGERQALWALQQDLGRHLVKKSSPPGPRENERAGVRARLAVQWLKLAGYPDADQLEKSALTLAAKAPAPHQWDGLGDDLRQALAVHLPQQWQQMQASNDLAGLSRLAPALHPNETLAGDETRANPAAQRRRQEIRLYYSWLADSYKRQSQAAVGTAIPFFAESAAEYRAFVE